VDELAYRGDVARLARLQVSDEVPAESLGEARVFRLEVLEAVLADD
jgi:hypothetical protein